VIDPLPRWRFELNVEGQDIPQHAVFIGDSIVGPWFRLERETGRPIWCRSRPMPDAIYAVSREVILAGETVSQGPGTYTAGIYAISWSTGEVLWTHHHAGDHRLRPAHVDLAAAVGDRDRDRVKAVVDDRVITCQGRVLDLETGVQIATISRDELAASPNVGGLLGLALHTPAWRFYAEGEVALASGHWLALGDPKTAALYRGMRKLMPKGMTGPRAPFGRGEPLRLHRRGRKGQGRWDYELGTERAWIDSTFYALRLVEPYLYFVYAATETPHVDLTPPPNQAHYQLACLELDSGHVVQTLRVGDESATAARIEDADARTILLSVQSARAWRLYAHAVAGAQ
jgi:hypothetical protein